MGDKNKALTVGMWIFSPFLLGFLREPLGDWLGIPTGRPQELIKLLLLPSTEELWMPAMIYYIIFLLLTAIAVSLAIERAIAYRGWRDGLLLAGSLTVSLLLFWGIKEVGVTGHSVFSDCSVAMSGNGTRPVRSRRLKL